MSLFLSPHFSIGEFACKSGEAYPSIWIAERLMPLVTVLEAIRTEMGNRPIYITSGYRSELYNRKIGGAKLSQHVAGRAADFEVDGFTPTEVHAGVMRLFKAGKIKIGGVGIYRSWVHVDVRPWQGHLCQWVGSGIGSEMA